VERKQDRPLHTFAFWGRRSGRRSYASEWRLGRRGQNRVRRATVESKDHHCCQARSNFTWSYDGAVIEGSILHRGRPVPIPADVRSQFKDGDQLFATDSGRVLHVPAEVINEVDGCVQRAKKALQVIRIAPEAAISGFFRRAAEILQSQAVRRHLIEVNDEDVRRAEAIGRSTTRLRLDDRMLDAMQESFEIWANQPVQREVLVEEIRHGSWTVSQVLAPLGVVGFVFEGRPNVVVDACGVLVSGNSCVFRIGRDARRTAEAILKEVVEPALLENDLPADSVVLISRDDHASGWALFSNDDVSLAVARGSGTAVQDLGSVASQSGVPVSLHGRGGAWFLIGDSADQSRLQATLRNSLDRKVCNTANVVTIPISHAAQSLTTVLKAVDEAAAARGATGIVHLISDHGNDQFRNVDFSSARLNVVAADIEDVQTEWEWENDPEITVLIVDSFEQAVSLFNESSPRLVASIISEDPADHEYGWNHLSCPFVGDGFSRWVDGQFALQRPELGLSNWESGVPLGRGAILSGGDIHSVRYRVRQHDENLRR